MLPIASTPIGNTVAPNATVTLPTDPVTATPSTPNATALCVVTDPTHVGLPPPLHHTVSILENSISIYLLIFRSLKLILLGARLS